MVPRLLFSQYLLIVRICWAVQDLFPFQSACPPSSVKTALVASHRNHLPLAKKRYKRWCDSSSNLSFLSFTNYLSSFFYFLIQMVGCVTLLLLRSPK